MSIEPKFYNKDGSLSRYGLAYGYVEVRGNFQLYMGHSCYHIVGRDNEDKLVIDGSWSLVEARKILRRLARLHTKQKTADQTTLSP